MHVVSCHGQVRVFSGCSRVLPFFLLVVNQKPYEISSFNFDGDDDDDNNNNNYNN